MLQNSEPFLGNGSPTWVNARPGGTGAFAQCHLVIPDPNSERMERVVLWRGHSCLPRRESSRRLSGSLVVIANHVDLLLLEDYRWSSASRQKRLNTIRRDGRHECPRHSQNTESRKLSGIGRFRLFLRLRLVFAAVAQAPQERRRLATR